MSSRSTRRILAVTGEPSGERHLAGVIRAFVRTGGDPVHWYGSGGDQMRAAGVEICQDVGSLSAIGPVAAMGQLPGYLRLFRRVLADARRHPPDLAVLVDFPDFNLRLAPRLKRLGIPVCYYISPQSWAWRPGRVEAIRRYVDQMLVILPFEVPFYRDRGVKAHFVGHPSLDLRRFRQTEVRVIEGAVRVGLLPGSRRREVEEILPVQLDAAEHLNRERAAEFLLIVAPGLESGWVRNVYQKWSRRSGRTIPLRLVEKDLCRVLPAVDCAIIKSGTATLEAMILEVPFVMVYRMAPLSYHLLRPWVRTKTFCLANLVAEAPVVPEFVQNEARGDAIAAELLRWLEQPDKLTEVKQKLSIASERLGSLDAYPETARRIRDLLEDGAKR